MARPKRSDVTLAPLDSVTPEAVARFVEVHGVARFLTEPPYLSGSRHGYLISRVLADAACDDAVAVAALRGGDLVGVVVLRYPQWDREHFGYVVGRVEHLQGADEAVLGCLVDETVRQLRARGVRMCSARLSNDALAALHHLQRSGFRYVELTLALWRDLSTWEPKAFGVTRPTRADDLDRMCAIARKAFRTDRFHRDGRFDSGAADGVYEKWIRSWHAAPSPSRLSRALSVDHEVAGFLMFEFIDPTGLDRETVASLVLGGVDPSRSGRGHGMTLWCDVLDVAASTARFVTATVAAANPAVINMYAKLGFRLGSSGEVTMHWWSEE
jgi:ribosomal protein S18 acetylase RimI-like enzyme